MTVMAMQETAHVGCARLADGIVVQLAGELTAAALPTLRQVLMAPMPPDCRDVVVDAGAVDYVDDAALAVLVAAREWIEEQGCRFLMSRTSFALDEALEAHGCTQGLPRLAELPRPRSAT